MPDRRRQWIAVILSGIFPGLGQFYVRDWGKGVALFLAGGVASWALGRLLALDELLAGRVANPGAILGATLVLLAAYFWSVVDAWVSAGRARR